MIFEVIQRHLKWHELIGHMTLPILVVCNSSVSDLHKFLNVPTSTVYATAYDLEKAFSLDAAVAFRFICILS